MLKGKSLLKIWREKNLKVKLLEKCSDFLELLSVPSRFNWAQFEHLRAFLLPSFAAQVYLESKQKTNVFHHHQVMPEGCDVWSMESKRSRVKVSL